MVVIKVATKTMDHQLMWKVSHLKYGLNCMYNFYKPFTPKRGMLVQKIIENVGVG